MPDGSGLIITKGLVMSNGIREFLISQGYSGSFIEIHKFGRITGLGTSFTPVCIGGVYKTPTPSAVSRLRVKAGDANDTANGTGARMIRVDYIDTNLRQRVEYLTTAGASPSDWTTLNVFRLLSFRVHQSGTYASYPNFSHAADIVLEDESLAVWGTISATDIPRARSQIGVYSVPQTLVKGAIVEGCFLSEITFSTATNKSVDFIVFERQSNLDETVPYNAATIIDEFDGVELQFVVSDTVPRGPYSPGTDIGVLAKASVSSTASVNLELILALR